MTYTFNDNNIISFSYYDGKDNLSLGYSDGFFQRDDLEDDHFVEIEERYQLREFSKWGNRGGTFRFARQWNNQLFTEVKIAGSKFFRTQDLDEAYYYRFAYSYDTLIREQDTLDFDLIRQETEAIEEFSSSFESDNQVKENSVTISADYKFDDRNTINFGLFNIRNDIKYQNIEDGAPSDEINIKDDGSLTGIYTQFRHSFNRHKGSLIGGGRFTMYSQTGKLYFEPRLSVSHTIGTKFSVKAAYGKYYQFATHTSVLDVSAAQSSFWLLSDEDEIPRLESNHYVAGLTYRNNGYLIDAEAYYKRTKGLSSIAFNAFFDDSNDEQVFFTGEGTGVGLEVLFRKDYNNYSAWIAYTLSRTLNQFDDINDGKNFAADQDQRHEIKFIHQLNIGKFDINVAWIYGSGRPYSPPDSVAVPIEGGFAFYLPSINIDRRNTLTLPAYHRLDLSVGYNAQLGNADLSFGVNLLNLYNRRNIRGYRYAPGFDEEEQTDFINKRAVNLLSFTPSLYLNIKF